MKALLHGFFFNATRRAVRAAALLALVGVALPAWSALSVNAGNGTVSDSATNLMWDQCPYGLSGGTCATGTAFLNSWQHALAAAAAANAAHYKGFNNWRVPNKNELESLTKTDTYSAGQAAIDATAFPGTPITGDQWSLGGTWTSTTFSPDPASAWYIAFNYGKTFATPKTNFNYLRLVRNGQSLAPYDGLAMDLGVTNLGSVNPVVAGSNLSYTITVTNGGPAVAEAATWNETLPAGTSFVSLLAVAGWGCTTPAVGASGSVSCANPSVASGASAVFTLTVAVDAAIAEGTVLSSMVSVSSTSNDVNVANNSATVSTTVTALPDTTPDAFSFTAQTDVALSTVVTSNSITVAGINSATAISISGGTYAVNGGAYTASAGTVNNGDSVTVRQTSSANYSTTTTATLTIGGVSAGFRVTTLALVTPPPDPTPTIAVLSIPASCGLVSRPQIVDLSQDEGPAFVADMVAILSSTLGMPLQFVEQTVCGTVSLSGYHGGKLAFVPFAFQSGDNRANGLYPVGDGQYQLVRNGQQLTLAPALVHLEQLVALLPGLTASQADSGAISASLNGARHVVQPGPAVQLDTASGSAQLLQGSDGYFHFMDTLGNQQLLYPAFAEPATLRGILLGLDSGSTLNVELDGTAAIVLNGQHYTLVPDLTLGVVPAERVGQGWWQESARRYWVVNVQTPGTAQGFMVKP